VDQTLNIEYQHYNFPIDERTPTMKTFDVIVNTHFPNLVLAFSDMEANTRWLPSTLTFYNANKVMNNRPIPERNKEKK